MLEGLVDWLIVLLLGAVLTHGALLQRRLQRLHSGDGELARLVDGLSGAVGRAEAALCDLKRTALESREVLDADRVRAQDLIDDLKMLSDRAEREADRLAEGIRAARPLGQANGVPAHATIGPARRPAGSDELEQALRTLR